MKVLGIDCFLMKWWFWKCFISGLGVVKLIKVVGMKEFLSFDFGGLFLMFYDDGVLIEVMESLVFLRVWIMVGNGFWILLEKLNFELGLMKFMGSNRRFYLLKMVFIMWLVDLMVEEKLLVKGILRFFNCLVSC